MNKNNTALHKLPNTNEDVVSQVSMSMLSIGKSAAKARQVVVRFDQQTYNKICERARIEHRGLGEFVRHATLSYIENITE